MSRCLRIVSILVAAIIVAIPVSAAIWIVEPDGTGMAVNIQAAISSAAEGDTVLLAPGVYSGEGNWDINFSGKSLLVMSQSQYDSTVTGSASIVGMGGFDGHAGFVFNNGEDSTSIVRNVRLAWLGRGIDCNLGSPRISSVFFDQCMQCVVADSSSLIIENSGLFPLTYDGSLVYCTNSSPRIINNMLSDSYALSQNCISCSNCSLFLIQDNDMTAGGEYVNAISISNSTGSVINNDIGPVTGYLVSALYINNSNVIIQSNNISDSGSYNGTVISCDNSTLVIENNLIRDNISHDYCVRVNSSPYSVIRNNAIIDNQGGGIWISAGSEGIISDNNISNNHRIGGIYCSSSITISGNTIINNQASFSEYTSGGITCNNCAPLIANNIIAYNNREYGAGVYCNDASPEIFQNTIVGNIGGSGIGIYIDAESNPIIANNLIASNQLGGSYVTVGGGIYTENDSISISCNDVYNNAVSEYLGIPNQTGINGNISVDPLFCDPSDTVYTLRADSPCLPGNHPDECDCGLIGALGIGCGIEAPWIADIRDVLNDQGRQVTLSWYRSMHDSSGSTEQITHYEIYRRIDEIPLSLVVANDDELVKAESGVAYPPGDWHYLFEVPAHVEDVYNVVATTLEDSCAYNDSTGTGEQLFYTTFFVRATTALPEAYFDSGPDSGYSVDNLAPAVPEGFIVAYNTGTGNNLSWHESLDEDFQYFNIYRITDPALLGDKVHSTIGTEWSDPKYDGSQVTYKLTVVDYNGNESEAAPPEVTVDADLPLVPDRYALEQNVPNPFNPVTTIRYSVKAGGGDVSLKIYDISGRHVRTLVAGHQTEGGKTVTWDGINDRGLRVASGIYFCRMDASDYACTRKIVLLQ